MTSLSAKPSSGRRYGWADALLKYVDNPSLPDVVHVEPELLIVKDKYPKAQHHYLVLPRNKRLLRIFELTSEHVELVRHMRAVAHKHIVRKFTEHKFQLGFHAVPSMNLVHMHIVSLDFDSTALKKKAHYNSFCTKFFLPVASVISCLESNKQVGAKTKQEKQEWDQLLKLPLKCRWCQIAQPNLPKLKAHLKECFPAHVDSLPPGVVDRLPSPAADDTDEESKCQHK